MDKFSGAGIVEIRIYDDPSHPETSTYSVSLPITVLEAVLDTTTGKSLRTIITEQTSEINAAKTTAETAQSAVSEIQTKIQSGNINASTLGGKNADEFANAVHTHTATQISGLPTSLPANGGNADTVDGVHVVTTSALGLHRMASGTAAANSTNCPPGCSYGQYE